MYHGGDSEVAGNGGVEKVGCPLHEGKRKMCCIFNLFVLKRESKGRNYYVTSN
jgi:hypothetical protein